MKDGRTRMGHKLEQAVDMASGTVCGLTAGPTTGGDGAALPGTPDEAGRRLEWLGLEAREVVCDKGYRSSATMRELAGRGERSYVSEPSPTCSPPAACGARTEAGTRTSSSACWCTRPGSTSGF